ncbi:MAG: PEP-CTERM sorting domain-containing protein [Rubrivivax sp.]|nr:PEP-CTERM sorting domain-containing protein [Rubrivivax sp.]
MRFTKYLLSLLLALGGPAAWAQSMETYDSAYLQPVDESDLIEMLGFGRGGSLLAAPDAFVSRADVQPLSGARELFFDTWHVDSSQVSPGLYSLDNFVIDVAGSLQFTTVIFNSYDASSPAPVLRSVLFDLNAGGTQAMGSGTFTVLAECPVASCIFIQVIGTQEIGDLDRGYGRGNEFLATPVPEPASWALLGLGLAVVGSFARRRRP